MLEVRLFGTFLIRQDDKPVLIASRAAQSLFAYLILTAGTQHRREKLAGMFWPDAAEERARAYLRHELWRIRKSLSTGSRAEYLIADDMYIAFQASSEYWLDAAALHDLNENASVEELIDVLSIYQGELLPGFYEDSIIHEREHFQAIYEKNIARLLDLLEKEERWAEILDWAERWISAGQGPEVAYRYLMIAYDGLGDRTKVIATYQRCVNALRELDLEPSEQTRALAFKRSSKLNIPIPLTSFVGREQELKEVAGLFSKSRLITLTGSGGVGKTRLAIQVVPEVMDRFPDGIWFLDLAPLSDPALVPNTLVSVLGLRESGELSITSLLTNYFRSRTALVIFDNCEHLMEACSQLINSLLTSCVNLSILATSREALRVSGEIPYRVPSLGILKSDSEFAADAIANIESVRLFMERATVALQGSAIEPQNGLVVAQICRRLDGIPLAIELAAARLRMLSAGQILQRLDDRFNILMSGPRSASPRQQTLRATIEWSYKLLSEEEKTRFQFLAVFVGGWTLKAAEVICGQEESNRSNILDLLGRLVDKSLVQVELTPANGETRFRMLETIREYALERLTLSGEAEAVRQKHTAYYLSLALAADHKARNNPMQTEHDNMRAALAWCHSVEGGAELELNLAGVLGDYWYSRAYLEEGRGWLEGALAHAAMERVDDPQLRARALLALGPICAVQGDYNAAEKYFAHSLKLYEELGGASIRAYVINQMGWLARERGDVETARSRLEQSLAIVRGLGNKGQIAYALLNLGETLVMQEDAEAAARLLEESLLLSRELDDDSGAGWALNHLGHVAQIQGEYARAIRLHEESLACFRDSWQEKHCLPCVYQGLGETALAQGDATVASTHLAESLRLFHELGNRMGVSWCLAGLAGVDALNEDHERAAWLWGVAEALRQSIGARSAPAARATRERLQAEVRKRLGEDVFNTKWAEGQLASWEQAVKFALSTRA